MQGARNVNAAASTLCAPAAPLTDAAKELFMEIVDLKQSVLEDNDRDAEELRRSLKGRGICLLNLMSSPGSGKTSTLLSLGKSFKGRISWGVMEADIDSDVDAKTIAETGAKSIQLHTGGMCHLDADMTRQGVRELTESYGEHDIIILENVGNLVCPAEFDTGSAMNMMILSVPEGDDKPLKYPLMFQVCDLAVINKIDVLPYFDFDLDKCKAGIAGRNPVCTVLPISAKTGEGIEELVKYIQDRVEKWRN